MRVRLRVAAFEPFGGRPRNRALDAARAAFDDVAVLPVSFARLHGAIAALIGVRPEALLLVGEHGRARTVRVERVATNRVRARGADNDGARPAGRVAPGPAVRAAHDAKRLAAAARAAGVPARMSSNAGAFACNAALYHALALARPPTRVAFVHVPVAALSMRALVRALRAVGECLVRPRARARTPARTRTRGRPRSIEDVDGHGDGDGDGDA